MVPDACVAGMVERALVNGGDRCSCRVDRFEDAPAADGGRGASGDPVDRRVAVAPDEGPVGGHVTQVAPYTGAAGMRDSSLIDRDHRLAGAAANVCPVADGERRTAPDHVDSAVAGKRLDVGSVGGAQSKVAPGSRPSRPADHMRIDRGDRLAGAAADMGPVGHGQRSATRDHVDSAVAGPRLNVGAVGRVPEKVVPGTRLPGVGDRAPKIQRSRSCGCAGGDGESGAQSPAEGRERATSFRGNARRTGSG